jgi:hypothetical protein
MAGPVATLMSLEVRHGYRDGEVDHLFEFIPSPQSQKCLGRYGLAFKGGKGAMHIARVASHKPWPASNDEASEVSNELPSELLVEGASEQPNVKPALLFALKPRDLIAFSYTDMDFANIGSAVKYRDLSSENETWQHIKHSDLPIIGPWLRTARALALVRIPFEAFEQTQLISISLNARKVVWRFNIILQSLSIGADDQLMITDEAMPFDIAQVASDECEFVFETDVALPMTSRGPKDIKLIQKTHGRQKKTILNNLPAPSPDNIRLIEGVDGPRADIFIHV